MLIPNYFLQHENTRQCQTMKYSPNLYCHRQQHGHHCRLHHTSHHCPRAPIACYRGAADGGGDGMKGVESSDMYIQRIHNHFLRECYTCMCALSMSVLAQSEQPLPFFGRKGAPSVALRLPFLLPVGRRETVTGRSDFKVSTSTENGINTVYMGGR